MRCIFHHARLPSLSQQDLVKKLIVPELARPGAFYLYTTPPKQVWTGGVYVDPSLNSLVESPQFV